MTKSFCDKCKEEVKDNVSSDRVTFGIGKIKIECAVLIDGTANGGHLCIRCLKDVLSNGAIYRRGKLQK